jgi:hypothetical protein
MNVACPVVEDDVFYKLCFINKVGTQTPSQIGEERRVHCLQDTAAVIHDTAGRIRESGLEISTVSVWPYAIRQQQSIYLPSYIEAAPCKTSCSSSYCHMLVTVIPLLVNVTGD